MDPRPRRRDPCCSVTWRDTVERFWPENGAKRITLDPEGSAAEAMYDRVDELAPQTEAQRALRSQALNLAANVGQTRLLLLEHMGSWIPLPFLVILVFWLCIIFASFGLFAPRNAAVIAVLGVVGCLRNLPDHRARPVV